MDAINHPSHYTAHPSGVECIEITESLTFCMGNMIKYLWRAGLKESRTRLEDLKKALWYAKHGHEVRKRFRDWELPRKENDALVKKIRLVLDNEPDSSLLRTGLYVLIPEFDPKWKGPPKDWVSGWPRVISALEEEIGKG